MRRSMWVGGGREDIEEVIPISLNFILSFMASELSLTLKNKPLVSQVLKNTFWKWFAFSHFFLVNVSYWNQREITKKPT